MPGIPPLTSAGKFRIIIKLHPGVAQLVARLVRDQEAVGSNPATRTTLGALKLLGFKAPLLFSAFIFPFCFPFRLRDRADVSIHPVCTGLLHLRRHMAVDIQGKGCGVVAQVALDGLDVISRL